LRANIKLQRRKAGTSVSHDIQIWSSRGNVFGEIVDDSGEEAGRLGGRAGAVWSARSKQT
jgi:hypothetical protein